MPEKEEKAPEVPARLAKIYPQLYLTPGEEGAALYQNIVRRGNDAPTRSLAHFHGSGQDSISVENTPAGEVEIVTLGDRRDFETFLQIMAWRCVPSRIPPSQGAAILDGVINWPRIRAHQNEYFRAGGDGDGWNAEFKRFTADKRNFTDALIILSTGPYSAISAERAGMDEQDWLKASLTIRKAHECTHFICRRLFPDKKDALWDELAADTVGLYAAFGRYDRNLAELFLGVTERGYSGGRLENYVPDGPEKDERLQTLSGKVYRTLEHLEQVVQAAGNVEPYALAVRLEDEITFWKEQDTTAK